MSWGFCIKFISNHISSGQQNHIDVQQITLFSEDFVAGALTQNSWATEEKWQYWEQHFFAPLLQNLDKIKSFQIVTEQGIWQIQAKKWWQFWR